MMNASIHLFNGSEIKVEERSNKYAGIYHVVNLKDTYNNVSSIFLYDREEVEELKKQLEEVLGE